MAKTASRHFDHRHTQCGKQRRNDDGSLIANPASAVFIDLHTGDERQVEGFAGLCQTCGKRAQLSVTHAVKRDRHKPRTHLIIGNVSGQIAFYQE
ncbi:thiamine-monophosphate kinase [Alicyclobacillus hesperidum URH17-3-68]|nr:thiamine-monophosphate kinase [Alicyclobacillus hesperidum URH17-3-68]